MSESYTRRALRNHLRKDSCCLNQSKERIVPIAAAKLLAEFGVEFLVPHSFTYCIRFLPPRNTRGASNQDLHITACLCVLIRARGFVAIP